MADHERRPAHHGPPAADHPGRRARLRRRLSDEGLDALLVTDLVNVRYLTGFTGSSAAVLIAAEDAASLFLTDGRYATQARAQTPDLPHDIDRGSVPERALGPAEAPARIGFEQDEVSYAMGQRLHEVAAERGLELVATSNHVEALRAVKDAHELAALERACELSDQAFLALVEWLRPGVSELEIARFLDRTGEDLGSDGPSFPTIAASGPNGAIPHHDPTRRSLERGELLTVDFGALVAGYHADTTRTVAVGEPPRELRRVHDVVREAQAAGRAAAVVGVTVGAVDAAAREVVAAAGYGDRFVHPTGHAVGLRIHEAPTVTADGTATLEPGMAITVEPGIYLPDTGGVRIEDTVVVTTDGPARPLTDSPRELLVL